MSGIPGSPRIASERCTGCGRCVAACPLRLLTLDVSGFRKHAVLTDAGRCAHCGSCLGACPVGAVAVPPREDEKTVKSGDEG